jgi:predicted TIM-barrel fold metal-dependent hydrolase
MRIDCHAHLLPPPRMAKLIGWTRRKCNPAHPVPEDATLEALLDEYRAVGVDYLWNFAHAIFPDETDSLNDWNRRLGAREPRVLPFGTCHPLTPDHTGFEEFYGGRLPLGGFAAVLAAVPELTVVFAHANYPWIAESFELMARFPNLHVDTVHLFGRITGDWDRRVDQAAVWAELRRGLAAFPDRVLFGTDHPSGTGTLAAMYADVEGFGLAPELRAALLGATARRLVERVRPLAPEGAAGYNGPSESHAQEANDGRGGGEERP